MPTHARPHTRVGMGVRVCTCRSR